MTRRKLTYDTEMRASKIAIVNSIDTPEGDAKAVSGQPSRLWALLCLIVLAAFAVRVAAVLHWPPGTIESEGAEYTRIAENLRNGMGYTGIVSPGPQLVFPPLFPFLIAAASLVTHNFEWAGRLVSLVMGALLPLPVFGIASRLFGRRVGIVAAILTVFHPLLVNLSFSVLSEAPYTTLFLAAVYATVRALDRPSIRAWSLVGGIIGLAYLTRQEAVAVLFIAVLFALTTTEGAFTARSKRAAAAIGVFLVLALPQILFLYKATGKVRLDDKSAQFYALGSRILEADGSLPYHGQSDEPSSAPSVESWEPWQTKWAFYAIDNQLQRTGAAMLSHTEVVQDTQIRFKVLLELVKKGVRGNAPMFVQTLSERWLGGPFLPALALLGIFCQPWRQPQASRRLFVLVIAAAPLMATFTALWSQSRYYFVLVPLLIIWASNGLVEVGQWTAATSSALGWRALATPLASQYMIPGLIGLALIVYPTKAVRQNYIFADAGAPTHIEKEVGLWIGHQQDSSVRIMDLSIVPAYYANAQWVHFPYCSGDLALRFLDAAHVDYIVLRRSDTFTRYYQDWMNRGILDPRAERLRLQPDTDAEFIVYRWHRTG